MAQDQYPAEMVHQWTTLERQQRETEEAFRVDRTGTTTGAGLGDLLFLLLLVMVIVWAAVTFLPGTGIWNAWDQFKLNTFTSVGMRHAYASAPLLSSLTLFAIAHLTRRFLRNYVSPALDVTGLLGSLILIPLSFTLLMAYALFCFIGFIDGYIVLADWWSA